MIILEQYTEIQKRIKSIDNQEKYNHLYAGENNSQNEMKMLVYLSKLDECIHKLNASTIKEKSERQLWETTAIVWIRKILNYLETDDWK